MSEGDRPSDALPLAEPVAVETRGPGSRARRRLAIAAVAVIAVAALAIPIALRASGPAPEHRSARRPAKQVDSRQARIAVGAALTATLEAGSYRVHSILSETTAPGSADRSGPVIDASATINLDPPAMVATATVGGGLHVTSWTDATRQWEQGGGNYGLVAGKNLGPGQSISGFSDLVVSTLGPREGAASMMSLASPSGYLTLADTAITSAAQVGTTTFEGAALTVYEVQLDAAQLLHQPRMSAEQVTTAAAAFDLMRQHGYAHTAVRLGVDGAGFVRTARVSWVFSDGGVVVSDGTFSDFGCAGTVVLPTQAPAPPPAATCTSPDPAATTPPTSASSPATANTTRPIVVPMTPSGGALGSAVTTTPSSPEHADADAIRFAYAHFFDPALTADQRAALIQGGAAMRAFIDTSFARHAQEAAAGAIETGRVSVYGNTADVTFHAFLGNAESPANPGEMHGAAVRVNGIWKVSRDTYCMLSANDGEVCPAA